MNAAVLLLFAAHTALAAGVEALPAPTPAPWLEAPAYGSGSPCGPRREDRLVLACGGRGEVMAYGDAAALVHGRLGTFLVSAKRGVTRHLTLPGRGAWVGLGSGDVPYAIVARRLLRDGRDVGIPAERAVVVPGYLIVLAEGRVTVRTEPAGAVVTRRDVPGAGRLAVTAAGMAVVAIDAVVPGVAGLPMSDRAAHPTTTRTAAVFVGGRWAEIPRPEGRLAQVGGQVRIGGVALDRTGRHWVPSRAADTTWWADQVAAGSGAPGGVPPSTSWPTARRPVPPEPPPPPPPPRPANALGGRSLLLQTIGTSGNAGGQDVVDDILDAPHTGWSFRTPVSRTRDPRTELLLLADGVRTAPSDAAPVPGRVWSRAPHALVLDQEADTTRLVAIPDACDPVRVWSLAGLQLLTCAAPASSGGHTVYARVGDGWAQERVLLPEAAPRAYPLVSEDGTLLVPYDGAAWVRAPDAAGVGRWREIVAPGVTTFRPGLAGSVFLVTLRPPMLDLELVVDTIPLPLLSTALPEGSWYLKTDAGRVLLFGTNGAGETHLVQWPPVP
jgi:hypothetical protein